MERRVLLAIFLSFLVLYAYQAFFVKPVPKPSPASSPDSTAAGPGTAPAGSPTTATGSPAAGAGPSTVGQSLAATPPPGTTSLIGEIERARRSSRNPSRRRCLYESRRTTQELASEGLQGQSRRPARTGCQRPRSNRTAAVLASPGGRRYDDWDVEWCAVQRSRERCRKACKIRRRR